MVSLVRHFVPNPVSSTRTDPRPKCHWPPSLHTRYDGLNRRTLKRVYQALGSSSSSSSSSGPWYETRHFYYSTGWQVLEERLDDSAGADRQFVWGLRYIDDLILRDRDSDGDLQTGDYGKSGSGLDQRLYALQDANFNVVALSKTTGTIEERYRYTAYGKPTVLDGSFGSRSSLTYNNPILYTGREYDGKSGLHYYRNRYYHERLGRFVSRDPIGYGAGDANLLRYVRNAVTNRSDPSGKKCKCPGSHWTFGGIMGGASLVVGYSLARVTARCTKAELRAYRKYDCGDGICFEKPIHCYCEAKLSFHVVSGGPQVGVGGLAIFGSFDASTVTDEDISGGIGWSASIQFIIVGAEAGGDFSGDDSGDYGGGGLAPGLDVGVNLNWTWINVRSSSLICKRKDLSKHEKDIIRQLGPCTSKDRRITPPKIVDNPYAIRPPGQEVKTE